LALVAYSFFFPEYRGMGPGHWRNLSIWVMTLAPANAVFKKIH